MQRFPSIRFTNKNSAQPRAGLSLTEVIVLISVGLVLLAIFLPAVDRSRTTGRGIQCMNNMHNLALALQNWSSTKNGILPCLDEGGHNWPVCLLMFMDRNDIATSSDPQHYYNNLPISVFTCPSDLNNFGQPNGLSYGLNIGFGDFSPLQKNGHSPPVIEASADYVSRNFHSGYDLGWVSGQTFPRTTADDAEFARDTGVFSRDLSRIGGAGLPYQNDGFRMTLDRIASRDGMQSTLMILENHNARNWGAGNSDGKSHSYQFPAGNYKNNFSAVLDCGVGIYATPAGTERGDIKLAAPGSLAIASGAPHPVSRINGSPGRHSGASPFASSTHQGVVNVAFCDGRVRTLNEHISFNVYVRLMTSGGTTRGEEKLLDHEY